MIGLVAGNDLARAVVFDRGTARKLQVGHTVNTDAGVTERMGYVTRDLAAAGEHQREADHSADYSKAGNDVSASILKKSTSLVKHIARSFARENGGYSKGSKHLLRRP